MIKLGLQNIIIQIYDFIFDKMKCPKLIKSMVFKNAEYGPWKGNEFYGCSKYPKCKGLVNVSDKKINNESKKTKDKIEEVMTIAKGYFWTRSKTLF